MKPEINRKRNEKKLTTGRLNMLLKNQWDTKEIKKEIKKYLETNDNKNTTIQNPWHASKVVLKGRFIVIQPVLKKKKNLLLTI